MLRNMFLATFLFVAGCSDTVAYADQVAVPGNSPQIALSVAQARVRAPFDVQIMRENGDSLPTYASHDRYYVQGNAGERYIIRIVNPTPRRVEAVVSVDGLDVIDGESGDLRKRGYVVPAYGETRVEGFRTSQADVATFRFSSVHESYAGMKGKARNVGVVAVAIFEEQAHPDEQQVIVGDAPAPTHRGGYDYRDDLDTRATPKTDRRVTAKDKGVASADDAKAERAPAKLKKMAPPADAAPTTASRAPAPPPAAPGAGGGFGRARGNYDDEAEELPAQHSSRPGLGTEFGESRYSAASFTRFVRANGRPIAVAELRYNDVPGLAALGINVQPLPDANEIMTRETADPFPGDHGYARPPGR
jgi:hypothetical protein